jgi:hypothetical protein
MAGVKTTFFLFRSQNLSLKKPYLRATRKEKDAYNIFHSFK